MAIVFVEKKVSYDKAAGISKGLSMFKASVEQWHIVVLFLVRLA